MEKKNLNKKATILAGLAAIVSAGCYDSNTRVYSRSYREYDARVPRDYDFHYYDHSYPIYPHVNRRPIFLPPKHPREIHHPAPNLKKNQYHKKSQPSYRPRRQSQPKYHNSPKSERRNFSHSPSKSYSGSQRSYSGSSRSRSSSSGQHHRKR